MSRESCRSTQSSYDVSSCSVDCSCEAGSDDITGNGEKMVSGSERVATVCHQGHSAATARPGGYLVVFNLIGILFKRYCCSPLASLLSSVRLVRVSVSVVFFFLFFSFTFLSRRSLLTVSNSFYILLSILLPLFL